jgi:hypothetical protein
MTEEKIERPATPDESGPETPPGPSADTPEAPEAAPVETPAPDAGDADTEGQAREAGKALDL